MEGEKSQELYKRVLDSDKFFLIGKMASSIAHEINNPIMIISNLISLIVDDIDEKGLTITPESEYYENLTEILNECRRVAKITKTLHDFSRPSSSKSSVHELKPLILDVLKLMEPMIVKAQVQVKLNFSSSNPRSNVRHDEIQQVLVHLIDNSLYSLKLKYPSPISARDHKLIEITLREQKVKDKKTGVDKEFAIIDVHDDGLGIPELHQNRIFDPFFTTKKAKGLETEKTQGLGLGLTFSKTILEDHQGFIDFESKPNEYALFHIHLPLVEEKIKDHFEEVVF
jgi:two-component system NtrC family sensor kinase